MTLYRGISRLDGVTHDPCVLDCFLAAVEFAKTGSCKAWWKYTLERKVILEAGRTHGTGKKQVAGAKRARGARTT